MQLLVVLLMVSVYIASNIYETSAQQARWCTISATEHAKCEGMGDAFALKNLLPAITCERGLDVLECLSKINQGNADLITLDGGDVYAAGTLYGMQTVMAETYKDGDGYYAVAVARQTDTDTSMLTLKGLRSCHTGVKKTAGWNVPVGYLLEQGLMDAVACDSDIKSTGLFFNASCAPGALSTAYNPNGDNPLSLCESCNGTGVSNCKRGPEEPYYNYDGAFRCLAENAGDVAFVKHLTVPDYTDGNSQLEWAQGLQSSDYVLLCPDGSRKSVDMYATCNLAWVPSHAVVTSSSASSNTIASYRTLLSDAQTYFGADDNPDFEMFDSTFYGGVNLLFKDSTQRLVNTASTQYDQYLGAEYVRTIRGLKACPSGTARWCVTSQVEKTKCQDMQTAFASLNLQPLISCAEASDHVECMSLIKDDLADLVTLDGGDTVTAGNMYKMQPVAGENYNNTGDETASYWAVVVAKKGTSFGFNDLKGKKSCHTGIMKTSGWIVPVGTLIDRGDIMVQGCDVPGAVGEFFSSCCVPGAKSPKYDPDGTNPDNLCDLCIGIDSDKCARSSDEPYYGYSGSFRCLAEEAGDVAFVKHVTVNDNTNGNNPAQWAMLLEKANYELLCEDGTRAPIDDWMTCHLARVPSHVVMTSGSKTTAMKEKYWNLLNDGQKTFGTDSGSAFHMFDSSKYGAVSDLLFKDSTSELIDVAEKDTYQEWVGEEYLKSYEAVSCINIGDGAASHVGASLLVMSLALLTAMFSWK